MNARLGEHRLQRLRETLEAVYAHDKAILHPTSLQLTENVEPRDRPLRRSHPQAEDLLLSLKVDRKAHEDRPRLHGALLAILHEERVEMRYGVDLLQRTRLPSEHVFKGTRRYVRDERGRNVGSVEFLDRLLNRTRALAPGVEVDDRFVESAYAPLALLHYLRLEGAVTIPGHLQIERARLGLDPLPHVAVAAVAAVLACYGVGRITQIVRQFSLKDGLYGTLAYRAEQALAAQQGFCTSPPKSLSSSSSSFACFVVSSSMACPPWYGENVCEGEITQFWG